ncbi:MAG: Crp/Fnr family transcriptional regulator [Bacteroidales bacterium]|nr:Crp/Fnr family transcriptional regulator [Bacteroidales bacterium]
MFDKLSKTEFEALHDQRKEVVFKPGEVIFKQGTALTHFACFKEGMAKVYHERPEGSNILINLVGSGKLCGSIGLYTDNVHHATVQALTDVKICLISAKNIEKLLTQNNDMAVDLITNKNESIIELTNKLANLTYKSMAGRVADVLLYLQKDIYKSDSFDLNLTRQDLADLAAMTKESFIRSLKEMKDSGIINVNRNQINIINLNALLLISEK